MDRPFLWNVNLGGCKVLNENDYVPIVLTDENIALAKEMGKLQFNQSRKMNLKDRSIYTTDTEDLSLQIWSKLSEYAIHQYFGGIARVTKPGDFHDYPDVGQVNVRHIMDPQDGLAVHVNDQGELPLVLTTTMDRTFSDKTIWAIGWHLTDHMRRVVCLVNQGLENKTWCAMGGSLEPHEQFFFIRKMLYPMHLLSKEFVNTPYVKKNK